MEEKYVKGTCETMCPKKEAQLRQKENLLHKFEMKKGTQYNQYAEYDPEKIVKSFSRSAAGMETTNPSNLRPFPVLRKTIEYLYREIFPLHREKPLIVYNFMFDRFRAVRQDAVIQNLSSFEMIQVLEPIVRFLVYFSYVLVGENTSNFDSHINNTHLQECMKRLLVCYDELEVFGVSRWDIESTYLLFNLGNIKSLTRGIRLCKISMNRNYNYCVKLSFVWYLRNYIRVFEMITKLPPLLLCVVNISVPEIRRYAFQAVSFAYSSVNSAYPVSKLRSLLLYENDSQVVDDCRFFNIKVSNGKINFLKKDFDMSVKCNLGRRLSWVDDKLARCNLVELLCFGGKSISSE